MPQDAAPLTILTDTVRLDLGRVCDTIINESYWGGGRSRDWVLRALNNAIYFGAGYLTRIKAPCDAMGQPDRLWAEPSVIANREPVSWPYSPIHRSSPASPSARRWVWPSVSRAAMSMIGAGGPTRSGTGSGIAEEDAAAGDGGGVGQDGAFMDAKINP